MRKYFYWFGALGLWLSGVPEGWPAEVSSRSHLLTELPALTSQNWTLQDLDGDGLPELGIYTSNRVHFFHFQKGEIQRCEVPPGTVWLATLLGPPAARLFAFDGSRVLETELFASPPQGWTPAFTNALAALPEMHRSSPLWQKFVYQRAGGQALAAIPDDQGNVHLWRSGRKERVIQLASEKRVREFTPQVALLPFSSTHAAHAFVLGDFAVGGVCLIGGNAGHDELLLVHDAHRCLLLPVDEPVEAEPEARQLWSRAEPPAELSIAVAGRSFDLCEQTSLQPSSVLEGVAGGELNRCALSRCVFDYEGRLLARHPDIPLRGERAWKLADVDGNGLNDLTLLNIRMFQYGDKDALTRFLLDHKVKVDAVTSLENWPPGRSAGSINAPLEILVSIDVSVTPDTVLHLRAISAAVAQRVCFGDFDGDGARELAYLSKPDLVEVLKVAGKSYRPYFSKKTQIPPASIQAIKIGPKGREAIVCKSQNSIELLEYP